MIITRYGPKRSRPVRGRNSRRTRKASPRFKAWYDRQARINDYIDRRDAYDLSADEVEGIAPENLRALQEAGYLQVFRRTAPAWTPPRPRDQVKRGRPSTSGWTGPLPYETIAEALGLANASVAFKAEARAIAKLRKIVRKKGCEPK